jgi:hypothetical protein
LDDTIGFVAAQRTISTRYAYTSEERVPSGWNVLDDAPELMVDMLAGAEVFKGDRFVR